MSSKTEERPSQEEIGVLVGLLDFNSDRAEAQASFLIACVFGLFALLAVAQNMQNEWLILSLTIPYVMLALVGFHCLQRFSFYANVADSYKHSLERYVRCLSDETTESREHPYIHRWVKRNGEWKKIPVKDYEKELLEEYEGILKRFKRPLLMKLSAILIFGIPFSMVYLPKLIIPFFIFICQRFF